MSETFTSSGTIDTPSGATATFSLTHSDAEWMLWVQRNRDVYDVDFNHIMDFCIHNGRNKWDAPLVRRQIELRVRQHYKLEINMEELGKLMSREEIEQYKQQQSFNREKYVAYLEHKIESLKHKLKYAKSIINTFHSSPSSYCTEPNYGG